VGLSTFEEEVVETIKKIFPDYVLEAKIQREKRIAITVEREHIVEVARFLKENFGFNHIASVTGIDYLDKNEFKVVYHVWSINKRSLAALKTSIPGDNPHLPSLTPVWEGAIYHERETWEMFGIVFDGHPNLSRFLLPEDWDKGYPFRKEFKLRTTLESR